MPVILIADSGATKAEWCMIKDGKQKMFFTPGLSPYFLTKDAISDTVQQQLVPKLNNASIDAVFFYGTGCASIDNAKTVKKALAKVFTSAQIYVNNDLLAAARAVCGKDKGVVANLGTGSFCCFYNGKNMVNQRPGIGYALGDEGSGAYLGRKVVQYYLYETFDEDLRARFDAKFVTTRAEILENVYKKPLPNRYLASFTMFLAENRGHYMVENIIEDGLNDFFFQHLNKYNEVWKYPVNFVGSVAYGFQDILQNLCSSYEFEIGAVIKNPMQGLAKYHNQ